MRTLAHVRVPIGQARTLLGLLSTVEESTKSIVVYFHGFPDLSVHPNEDAPPAYASRFPRKLEEALAMDLLCVNFSGLPGSDGDASYRSKTLSRELEDARGIVAYCATELQKAHVHVVGLSTGAILAACLRDSDHPQLRSISVVAGIVDACAGSKLDFSHDQLTAMRVDGQCETAFYWPAQWPLANDCRADTTSFDATGKVWRPLARSYVDDMEQLDIAGHVIRGAVPLLVVHGTSDKNVPLEHGAALFATAREPKQWLEIKGANHLLSNARHIKKAFQAISAHIAHAEVV
ncbi:hypothetical protein SPRG_17082 [Saprolegnia parasitica CBS 223.65]|uniref:AB hydrolase-1 domain-containing protein n=1 Tax=Saprolegnia parasitica (strain CBS 223.65) TaxID=695850 RepID=A0A067BGY5_SAPPC|nr:hypothetical protein SPRG_17082 [Saprolegnia parasitica CBS 223.65]KDO17428.1 hypothetical protein SPRG_17082 [Saprolegnia parasitica CBS 223.65]|eukprot:XP_012211865.1 hypothetical protein SPRG_17082 [Saprolegnia parasitica CBS 223.65]